MKASLKQGINDLKIMQSLLRKVRDPDGYQIYSQNFVLSSRTRYRGLPDDEARKAFRAHKTRLGNLSRSRMVETERRILVQRQNNIKTAEKIYITLQKEALGIKVEASKDRDNDLSRGL